MALALLAAACAAEAGYLDDLAGAASAMKDSVTENAPDMGGIGDKIKAMKDNVADRTSVRQSQFVPRGPPSATALAPRTSVSNLFAFDVAVWR